MSRALQFLAPQRALTDAEREQIRRDVEEAWRQLRLQTDRQFYARHRDRWALGGRYHERQLAAQRAKRATGAQS